jgi:hypothetical protein
MPRSLRGEGFSCMGNESQNSEPRSRFITRRTSEILRRAPLCVRKFASSVAALYMSRTAEHERVVQFDLESGSIDAACRAEVRNAKKVQHLLDCEVRFPADLEEAWVDALPEPHKKDLIRELAARYGLIGARAPARSSMHAIADLASVLRDAGEISTALAPAFANGTLDASDVPYLVQARPIISRAVADCASLLAQITTVLDMHHPHRKDGE